MVKRIPKKIKQEIALDRVKILFKEAQEKFKTDPKLAQRYVDIARKTAMKVNLRMPKELKRKICKYCYHYLVPSKTCRVRIHKNKVIYYCLNCKNYMRYMIKKKVK